VLATSHVQKMTPLALFIRTKTLDKVDTSGGAALRRAAASSITVCQRISALEGAGLAYSKQ
jgi:hypothetical protein